MRVGTSLLSLLLSKHIVFTLLSKSIRFAMYPFRHRGAGSSCLPGGLFYVCRETFQIDPRSEMMN